jgi:aspartate/methionine/tyrosine aminotransferase
MSISFPRRVLDIPVPPFDALNARAAQLRKDGHHVISLGQALPFFGPPASAVRAAKTALESSDVHVYSADAGLHSLRTALASRLEESAAIECGSEDIIITAGANQAFMLALMTLLEPGDEVVIPAPYFVNHYMSIGAVGAVAVEAPLADGETFSVAWEDIEPHLTSRTKGVVLCNPSNPTGATIARDENARLVNELADRAITVFSDETYMHFVFIGEHASAAAVPAWRRNVVVVGTFSKSFGMTGWRTGYLLADARVCEQALKIQDAMIICAPVVSQIAVEAAVRENWWHARTFKDDLLSRRHTLKNGLAPMLGVRWAPTAGGFFAFVRISGCVDSTALADRLLEEAHVVTIPGAAFGRHGEGCLRLSYGSASVAEIGEALQRLGSFFECEERR